MLPGKVEKRIASSVFITLVPPRREAAAKERAPKERQLDGAEDPSTQHPHTSPPQPPELPNGGTHPAAPVLVSSPVLVLSEAPKPLSAEALGPALQQLDLAASTTLQAPSTLPAELRPPKLSPEQAGKAAWQDANGHLERDNPRDICAFCHKALGRGEAAVEALRKLYHAGCFTCRSCQRPLAAQRYYQRDGRPICDSCYQATLEKCAKCQGLIVERIVRALGKGYHPGCFSCSACGRAIGTESFAVDEWDEVYCVPDFYRKYATVCSACELPIIPGQDKDTYKIECLGRSFHEGCYRCEEDVKMLGTASSHSATAVVEASAFPYAASAIPPLTPPAIAASAAPPPSPPSSLIPSPAPTPEMALRSFYGGGEHPLRSICRSAGQAWSLRGGGGG
ncbi:filamin-binding LIM protein 1 [Dryobates pubescens]|uniref:filamin-binding LIM protein 1 n=1 Tax=Dryobates pubescens TaxID=118200 RepID=UPI0023B8D6CE|nr:filamin-binding LIM protein 1 [Dryobates pubescens]